MCYGKKFKQVFLIWSHKGKRQKLFLEQHISGEVNLWDRMTNVLFLNCDDLCKETTLKISTTEYQLRSTTSVFSRLLANAKSDCNLDLDTGNKCARIPPYDKCQHPGRSSYIALYTSPPGRPVHSNAISTSQGSIQQLLFRYPPLYIARYSFIQLSEL